MQHACHIGSPSTSDIDSCTIFTVRLPRIPAKEPSLHGRHMKSERATMEQSRYVILSYTHPQASQVDRAAVPARQRGQGLADVQPMQVQRARIQPAAAVVRGLDRRRRRRVLPQRVAARRGRLRGRAARAGVVARCRARIICCWRVLFAAEKHMPYSLRGWVTGANGMPIYHAVQLFR